MKKHYHYFLILFLICISKTGYCQTPSWNYFFGKDSGSFRDFCQDKDGNYIITGSLKNPLPLNNGQTLTPITSIDLFIVKTDSKGNVLWGKNFDGGSDEEGSSVAVMADNSVLVLGFHEAGFKLGQDSIGTDFPQFLIKLTPEGDPLWTKPVMGDNNVDVATNGDKGTSIAVTESGNIIIASKFLSSFSLNGHSVSSLGHTDVLVAKYNPEGDLLWVNTLGTTATDILQGLTSDGDDNIYVSCQFGNYPFYLNHNLYNAENRGDVLVAKFSASGELVKDFIITDYSMIINTPNNLIFSPHTGNLYFARQFVAHIEKYGMNHKPNWTKVNTWDQPTSDLILIEFDTSLNVLASTQAGGLSDEKINCMTTGPHGIYLGTEVTEEALFEFQSVNSTGNVKMVIAAFNYDLTINWLKEFQGSYNANVLKGIRASDTNVTAIGHYIFTLTYDTITTFAYETIHDFFVVSFKEEKSSKNILSGTVYRDDNGTCIQGNPIQDLVLHLSPTSLYRKTDSQGKFRFNASPGSYDLIQILPPSRKQLILPLCNGDIRSVLLDEDLTEENFYNKVTDCYHLSVDIQSDRRRRCMRSSTVISYLNDGNAAVDGVEIKVIFPPYVEPVHASLPFNSLSDSSVTFTIGTLEPGEAGKIYITDSVSCHDPAITGTMQCTKAIITPKNHCTPINTSWDESDIDIKAECQNDGHVKYSVTNLGQGNMSDSTRLIFTEGDQIIHKANVKLLSNEMVQYLVPATGNILSLEGRESADHPRHELPKRTVSGCSVENPGLATFGYTIHGSVDDRAEQVKINCMEIIDSYDPNDKSATLTGVTEQNLLAAGEKIEYLVRFQNTGTDTAYHIVIVDTLDSDLDISSLEILNSSHSFTWDLRGESTQYLVFTFHNIMLPDSNTNNLLSNGFLKYEITSRTDLVQGTRIENKAFIYFDYNFPVETNEVFHTIAEELPWDETYAHGITEYPPVITGVAGNNGKSNVTVYPNPATNSIKVASMPEKEMLLSLYSIDLKLVINQQVTDKQELDVESLPAGLYFYELKGANTVISGKLLIK